MKSMNILLGILFVFFVVAATEPVIDSESNEEEQALSQSLSIKQSYSWKNFRVCMSMHT